MHPVFRAYAWSILALVVVVAAYSYLYSTLSPAERKSASPQANMVPIGPRPVTVRQRAPSSNPRSFDASKQDDDATAFLASYAPPDSDDTTAYDKPRPPLVTRWFVYRPERVRVTFLAGGNVGDPPPYRTWHFLGFQDAGSNEVLSEGEAAARLATRARR